MIKKIILTVTISFFALLSSCVKINTLYDNYEQLEAKVLILEGEISQLTSALNSTTQALETATANYNNLQSSLDTQVSQLLSLIANLQDEKDSLEVELELVKDSLAELTDQINNIDVSVQNPNVVNSSEELNVGFSYEITGENQVTLSANIQNSQYQRIYVDYKNIEESNFKSIELSNENFTINLILNNLIQGPEYTFELKIIKNNELFSKTIYAKLPVTYKVGDEKFGGIIYEIYASGYHGKIVAKRDTYMLKKWSNKRDSSNDLNLSNRNTYDDGEENTNLILNYFNNVEDISPAAKYCNDLSVQGYDDWYLPSQKEIQKAATFLWSITSGPNSIRNIGSGIFWSSNTDSVINQRAQCSCVNGCNGSTNPPEYYKDSEIYVVAVRKF